MKAICFHCQFVGVGVQGSRCPSCDFPLIVNMGAVALGSKELETLFQHQHKPATHKAPLLPGVNPEKRQAQLLIERRRERARLMAASKVVQPAPPLQSATMLRVSRKRIMASFFAASALAALLLVTLNAII